VELDEESSALVVGSVVHEGTGEGAVTETAVTEVDEGGVRCGEVGVGVANGETVVVGAREIHGRTEVNVDALGEGGGVDIPVHLTLVAEAGNALAGVPVGEGNLDLEGIGVRALTELVLDVDGEAGRAANGGHGISTGARGDRDTVGDVKETRGLVSIADTGRATRPETRDTITLAVAAWSGTVVLGSAAQVSETNWVAGISVGRREGSFVGVQDTRADHTQTEQRSGDDVVASAKSALRGFEMANTTTTTAGRTTAASVADVFVGQGSADQKAQKEEDSHGCVFVLVFEQE